MLYKEENLDKANEIVVRVFKLLDDKNCSIKQSNAKKIQNACRKKNTPSREFIKHRTKEAENKYEHILKK